MPFPPVVAIGPCSSTRPHLSALVFVQGTFHNHALPRSPFSLYRLQCVNRYPESPRHLPRYFSSLIFFREGPLTNVAASRFLLACFQPCLQNFDSGGCAKADYHCLCNNEVFINTTAQCLYNDCSNPADIAQAIKTSQDACLAAVGIFFSSLLSIDVHGAELLVVL